MYKTVYARVCFRTRVGSMVLYFVGFPCFVFNTCRGIHHELFPDDETGRAVACLE